MPSPHIPTDSASPVDVCPKAPAPPLLIELLGNTARLPTPPLPLPPTAAGVDQEAYGSGDHGSTAPTKKHSSRGINFAGTRRRARARHPYAVIWTLEDKLLALRAAQTLGERALTTLRSSQRSMN